MHRSARWTLTVAVVVAGAAVMESCQRATEVLPPGSRVGYYVTTSGNGGGDGSSGAPWDLQTALDGANGTIHPGDTVWVRGGTYLAPFTSSLTGTSSASVIVRAYPGE